jgi:hypothetical protein
LISKQLPIHAGGPTLISKQPPGLLSGTLLTRHVKLFALHHPIHIWLFVSVRVRVRVRLGLRFLTWKLNCNSLQHPVCFFNRHSQLHYHNLGKVQCLFGNGLVETNEPTSVKLVSVPIPVKGRLSDESFGALMYLWLSAQLDERHVGVDC